MSKKKKISIIPYKVCSSCGKSSRTVTYRQIIDYITGEIDQLLLCNCCYDCIYDEF